MTLLVILIIIAILFIAVIALYNKLVGLEGVSTVGPPRGKQLNLRGLSSHGHTFSVRYCHPRL